MADRERLIELVEILLTGQASSEAQEDAVIAEVQASVPHPDVTNLVYYWNETFDYEPTAGEIVDRALAYRSTAL